MLTSVLYFTGPLPNMTSLIQLETLSVNTNKLSGTLNEVLGLENKNLQYVDISLNSVEGEIPNAIFAISGLRSFSASINCLTLDLQAVGNVSICNLVDLDTLVLAGLHASSTCVDYIFPDIGFQSYRPYFPMKAIKNIPDCLYSLPNLHSLYLSGNGITGTVPSELSKRLNELSLAHNDFRGIIPDSFQNHPFQYLDLSKNKFRSFLSPYFVTSRDMELYIDSNRLSGKVSPTMEDVTKINVLIGNIFTCDYRKSNLPRHDEHYENYDCGSNRTDFTLLSWFCIAISLFVAFIYFYLRSMRFNVEEGKHPKKYLQLNSKSWYANLQFYNILLNAVILMQSNLKGGDHCKDKEIENKANSDDNNLERFSNTGSIQKIKYKIETIHKEMHKLLRSFKYMDLSISIVILLVGVTVLIPLSHYFSNYYQPGLWTISAMYMSGIVPVVCCSIYFLGLLILFCTLWMIKIRGQKPKDLLGGRTLYSEHYAKKPLSWKQIQWLLMFGCVNVVVMIVSNILYIQASNILKSYYILIVQIIFGMFKVMWNQLVVYRLMNMISFGKFLVSGI